MKCAKCNKNIPKNQIIQCPNCKNYFHKLAGCVDCREVRYPNSIICPRCKKKTKRLNERFCPICGRYLWSLHFECGQTFKKQ